MKVTLFVLAFILYDPIGKLDEVHAALGVPGLIATAYIIIFFCLVYFVGRLIWRLLSKKILN